MNADALLRFLGKPKAQTGFFILLSFYLAFFHTLNHAIFTMQFGLIWAVAGLMNEALSDIGLGGAEAPREAESMIDQVNELMAEAQIQSQEDDN